MGSFVDGTSVFDIIDIVCSITQDDVGGIEDAIAIAIVAMVIDRVYAYTVVGHMIFVFFSRERSEIC
jgi:hypothetical protein